MAYSSYTYANPLIAAQQARDPRLAYAQGLMQQGASTAPVQSWGEGLARALQAGIGGVQARSVNKGYQAQDEGYRAGLSKALASPDVLGALAGSDNPYLQEQGMQARLAQALKGPEADPLVKVYDPAIKAERYMHQSEANGLQASAPTAPEAPKTAGGMYWDGTTYKPIPGYTEQAAAIAAAGRAPREPGRIYQDITDKDGNVIGQVDDRGKKDFFSQGITVSPDGTVQIGGSGGKLTESQGAATAYGKRMWDAETRIQKLTGADPTNLFQNLAAKAPGGNYLLTPEFQQYKQAATDWIRAKLRKESGATISPSELDSDFQTFWPQPGDAPPVIAQKAEARKSAFEGMVFQAGSGAEKAGNPDEYPTGAPTNPAPPVPPDLQQKYPFLNQGGATGR